MNRTRRKRTAVPPAVRILTLTEAENEDRVYWHSKTPVERLAALELLRQRAYGYDPATDRIQKVVSFYLLKQRS